jgi:hypothetical protein
MLNAQNTQSEDDISGKSRPVPGRYHAAVNHAEEKGSKKKGTPGLELEFQIVADGTAADGKSRTNGQAGKTIPLFLSYIGGDDDKTKTCLDRVMRLALCVGVLRPGEAKEPDWSEAIGRELVIEIEAQQYDDAKTSQIKTGAQVAFLGFWSLGNKAVSDVPKDASSPGMRALAKAGGQVSGTATTTAGNGNGGQAAATQPAATAASGTATATAATGTAKKKWSDIL